MNASTRILAPSVLLVCAALWPVGAQSYHVAHTYTLGGNGGWDYVTLDTAGHRLFIARQDRVTVVDPANGKVVAEIPGLNGAHGVALAYQSGRGFATSGRDSSVVMFDLKTLAVAGRTTAALDADAILYDTPPPGSASGRSISGPVPSSPSPPATASCM